MLKKEEEDERQNGRHIFCLGEISRILSHSLLPKNGKFSSRISIKNQFSASIREMNTCTSMLGLVYWNSQSWFTCHNTGHMDKYMFLHVNISCSQKSKALVMKAFAPNTTLHHTYIIRTQERYLTNVRQGYEVFKTVSGLPISVN